MLPAQPDNSKSAYSGPSFSFRNRFARAIWNFVYLVFFRTSPRSFHFWRLGLLRLFGANIQAGAHIYPGARIWAPWNLVCAAESAIADGAIIYNQALVHLGYRTVISQGAHLCTGTHLYNDPGFPLVASAITCEDYVWIAAEAFIHPGVTIREGAVIGARAVVIKDMPAWTVCAGHPCEPIKPRQKFI